MSDTSVSMSFPVMKGSSLSNMERSFGVLRAIGSSSLELKLSMGGSVYTFDKIIRASRSKSKAGSHRSIQVIDDDDALTTELEPSINVPAVLQDNVQHLNTRQFKGLSYLKRKKIFELFNFFIAQLLSARPDDPIDFLVMLLNQCLCVRAHFEGRVPPPLLFGNDHVKTVYDAFDVMKTGYITASQYKEAMTTLGFGQCEERQRVNYLGQVSKTIFIADATRRLTAHLRALIRAPNTS